MSGEHYLLTYPQALKLYDSAEEAKEARTKNERQFRMEIYKVVFHELVIVEEDKPPPPTRSIA